MINRSVSCLFLFALSVLAQTGGTITGTVVDLSGEPVANAEIQVTNTESKAVYKTKASAGGVYTFAQLPAGTYDLSATTTGFTSAVQRGLAMRADQTLQMNLRLQDYNLNTLGDGRDVFVGRVTARKTPAGPTLHLPDGRPDLSGVWHNLRTVDPGKPETKPWAEAIAKERAANNFKDGNQVRCLPLGVLLSGTNWPLRTIHTPTYLAIIFEGDVPGYRQIYLDGRGHPRDLAPTWTGHSIGHWEGDTLVVDTVGFNDKTWLPDGVPHSEKMHLTERFHRADLGHLEIEITIEDPDTLIKPWVIKRVADLDPNDEVLESICNENERDREHMVGK
jgi:Carboxypeptidase regulatory-like domain